MKNILVLGVEGLVGQSVYKFLKNIYPKYTFATARSLNGIYFPMYVESCENDLERIQAKIGKIGYIINCIGLTNSKSSLSKMQTVNGKFPHDLEKFSEKFNSKLILISTDAVFSKNSGKVNEISKPNPDTKYGKSKLNGEGNSKNSITFRTSFLGFDDINHEGFIEKIISKKRKVNVSTNKAWSGCTTLQFSQFCYDIIRKNNFDNLRKTSDIFHFVPIKNTSKYEIALKLLRRFGVNDSKIVKKHEEGTTRKLLTRYSKLINLAKYSDSLDISIDKLIEDHSRFLNSNSLAVVIPMFNEEKVASECVDKVMQELKRLKLKTLLIVVNDGSGDSTGKIFKQKKLRYGKNIIVINHKKNMGFGAGNISGIKKAIELNYKWVLHMDAGLTNDPKHIKVFINFVDSNYDCVKASRYIAGSKVLGVPKYRRLISIIGNNLASLLFGVGIKDCTNGFRMVRLSKLEGLRFKENNYSLILEELYYLKKRGSKFKEIPYTLKMNKKTVSHFNYKPKIFFDYFKYALKSALI